MLSHKPYETVLFGMYQGLLNCAQAWAKIPILLAVFFQMDIDTGEKPGGLWLVGPKLNPLFQHAKLTERPALREGGRDYQLISPHLSSPLLGSPRHHHQKRRGSHIWHMKAFKV